MHVENVSKTVIKYDYSPNVNTVGSTGWSKKRQICDEQYRWFTIYPEGVLHFQPFFSKLLSNCSRKWYIQWSKGNYLLILILPYWWKSINWTPCVLMTFLLTSFYVMATIKISMCKINLSVQEHQISKFWKHSVCLKECFCK